MSNRDHDYMREALRLARKGFPAPNPHVGCVIVNSGRIVGRGYHGHAGGPHAEIVALTDAGSLAKGATAYVTLEPCNHQGRTGPCSVALVQAGITRVVYAVADPTNAASGGSKTLRDNGVEVCEGVAAEEAKDVAQQFFVSKTQNRPLVVLKAAMAMDGRIALPSGESQWITGPKARKETHRLRAELGAVLVGRRTVEVDDPQLTARIPGAQNQPVRVVLDPQGKLDSRWKVFDSSARTLHITRQEVPVGDQGFDLPSLLRFLHEAGITGLLVEGGSLTMASFLRAGVFDRIELFAAPTLLGDGPSWVSGLGISSLGDVPRLRVQKVRRMEPDLQITLSR